MPIMNSTGFTSRLVLKQTDSLFTAVFIVYGPIMRESLTDFTKKHNVVDSVFLVDDADGLIVIPDENNLSYRVQRHGF